MSAYISLQSTNYPDRYIRHQQFLGELTPIVSLLDRRDATFRMVPGLAAELCLSFESLNYPDYYLRHRQGRIHLERREESDAFRRSATFRWFGHLDDPTLGAFEAYEQQGAYIRHRNFHLYLETGEGDLYDRDRTFHLTLPKYDGDVLQIATVGPDEYLFSHRWNSPIWVLFSQPVDPASITPDTFRVWDEDAQQFVAGRYSLSLNDHLVLFRPNGNYPGCTTVNGTTITVTLVGATSGASIRNKLGQPLDGNRDGGGGGSFVFSYSILG